MIALTAKGFALTAARFATGVKEAVALQEPGSPVSINRLVSVIVLCGWNSAC